GPRRLPRPHGPRARGARRPPARAGVRSFDRGNRADRGVTRTVVKKTANKATVEPAATGKAKKATKATTATKATKAVAKAGEASSTKVVAGKAKKAAPTKATKAAAGKATKAKASATRAEARSAG